MRLLLILTVTVILHGCALFQPDPAELLPGKWVVAEAIRDGKPTPTLSGLYLEFTQPDILSTNVAGAPEKMQYILEGKTIRQRGGSVAVDYDIMEIARDSMKLSTIINGAAFEITFNRETPR
jgi:hypothetical protein